MTADLEAATRTLTEHFPTRIGLVQYAPDAMGYLCKCADEKPPAERILTTRAEWISHVVSELTPRLAEVSGGWADLNHAEMIKRLDAEAELAEAEARVADLEAGIRRLCDNAWEIRGTVPHTRWVDRDALRALVGDETTRSEATR